MRVEDCIVTVERRTTGGCIDLAFVFVRRFALPLYTLTACIAGPALACVWFLGQLLRDDILLPSIAIFAVASMLLSGAMIATVGPQVFGVPISTRAAINGLIGRFIPYAFLGILFRMTGLCLFFPLIFVMAWCGHLPEVMFLEHTPLNQITQRLSWLGKGGGYSRNLGRVVTIMFFWIVIAVGLFMIIDLLSGWVFNAPIFFGTIAPGPDQLAAFKSKIVDDPFLITMVQLAFWLTYPIVRLAWFFCYLDQRIRNECWDLELQFRVEAGRIEEQLA